jgi:hypothetical protein
MRDDELIVLFVILCSGDNNVNPGNYLTTDQGVELTTDTGVELTPP